MRRPLKRCRPRWPAGGASQRRASSIDIARRRGPYPRQVGEQRRAVEGLVLDELAGDRLHDAPARPQRRRGALLRLLDDRARLGVDALERAGPDAAELLQRRAEEDLRAVL